MQAVIFEPDPLLSQAVDSHRMQLSYPIGREGVNQILI